MYNRRFLQQEISTGTLKEFGNILVSAHIEEKKGASNAQILWSACQALSRAVKVAPPGISMDEIIRPLEPEIQAVCKAAREYLDQVALLHEINICTTQLISNRRP